jgi:aldehyde dehydrogenase
VKWARSDANDVGRALDAAHAALPGWRRTAPAERARVLNKIADRIEENLTLLAKVETRDNGKPIRETMNADVPLAADHFRYFAACIRAEEGTIGEIDHDTIAYHFREPIGQSSRCAGWVARSCTMLPRPSFRRPWNWAASRPTSSSPT